jgi:hypothetical protein
MAHRSKSVRQIFNRNNNNSYCLTSRINAHRQLDLLLNVKAVLSRYERWVL